MSSILSPLPICIACQIVIRPGEIYAVAPAPDGSYGVARHAVCPGTPAARVARVPVVGTLSAAGVAWAPGHAPRVEVGA